MKRSNEDNFILYVINYGKMNEKLLELASEYPYPLNEIRPFFIDCHKLYYPSEKAVGKCRDIIETAVSMNIELLESYRLQFAIDFQLM